MIILIIALHYFYKVYGDRPTFNVPNENLDTSQHSKNTIFDTFNGCITGIFIFKTFLICFTFQYNYFVIIINIITAINILLNCYELMKMKLNFMKVHCSYRDHFYINGILNVYCNFLNNLSSNKDLSNDTNTQKYLESSYNCKYKSTSYSL